MFGNRINPGTAAAILAGLTGIAVYLYWPSSQVAQRSNSTYGTTSTLTPREQARGYEHIRVETLTGAEPGFADGPRWKARFCGPTGLAFGPDHSILVCDSRNHRLRRISREGEVSTLAGGGEPGGPGGKSDGPVDSARFRYPTGVAVSPSGVIYLADTGNHRICRIQNGVVSTLAGSKAGKAEGKGSAARFRSPSALTWGPDGALWVADVGNRCVRRVDAAGNVTTPTQPPKTVRSILGDYQGNHVPDRIDAYWSATTMVRTRFLTAGRAFADNSRLGGSVLATAGLPQVYPDPENHLILLDRGEGSQVLLAGGTPMGRANSPASVDGNGDVARLTAPCALIVDEDGTTYVAEYEGNRIRRLRIPPALLLQIAAEQAQQYQGF